MVWRLHCSVWLENSQRFLADGRWYALPTAAMIEARAGRHIRNSSLANTVIRLTPSASPGAAYAHVNVQIASQVKRESLWPIENERKAGRGVVAEWGGLAADVRTRRYPDCYIRLFAGWIPLCKEEMQRRANFIRWCAIDGMKEKQGNVNDCSLKCLLYRVVIVVMCGGAEAKRRARRRGMHTKGETVEHPGAAGSPKQ